MDFLFELKFYMYVCTILRMKDKPVTILFIHKKSIFVKIE